MRPAHILTPFTRNTLYSSHPRPTVTLSGVFNFPISRGENTESRAKDMSMIPTYRSSLSETLSQFQKHLCWKGEEDGQMEDRDCQT